MKSSSMASHSTASKDDYYYKSRRKFTSPSSSFIENRTWLRKHGFVDTGDDDDESSYKAKFSKRERKKIKKLKLAHDLIASGDIEELNLSHLLKNDYQGNGDDEDENDKEDDILNGGKNVKGNIDEIQILCQDLLDMKYNENLKYENCNLTILNLSRCHMGKDEIKALAKCFQSSSERSIVTTKLRTLNLSHNALNDEGITILAEAMSAASSDEAKPILPLNQCQLQELILKDNNIGAVGAKSISKILHASARFPHLTKLDIQHNHISDDGLTAISNSLLGEATRTVSSLRILHLEFNDIGPIGIRSLMEAYQKSKFASLQELYLCNNRLDDEGAIELANGLRSQPRNDDSSHEGLKVLYLRGNDICPKGISALSEALQQSRNFCMIETLNVSHNDIGDVGLQSLLDVIHNGNSSSCLKNLYLNDTDLTRRGIISLSETVQYHQSNNLQLLSLSQNESFGTEEAKILASCLKSNTSLQTLLLSDTNIDNNEGIQAFIDLIQNLNNTSLTHIQLPRDLAISVKRRQILDDLLVRNRAMKLFRTDKQWFIQSGYFFDEIDHELIDEAELCNKFDVDSLRSMIQMHDLTRFATAAADGGNGVKEIDLMNQQIGDFECRGIALCLLESSKLQRLWLSTNNIGPDGVGYIGNALLKSQEQQSSRCLRFLDISMNPIRDRGASIIGDLLKLETTCLEVLRMQDCQLSDNGAVSLSQALQSPTAKLQELILAGNSIGNDGAMKLAEAIRINATLDTLDLQATSVDDCGAKFFIHSIRGANTTLLYLDMPPGLSEGVVTELKDSLSRNAAINRRRQRSDVLVRQMDVSSSVLAGGGKRSIDVVADKPSNDVVAETPSIDVRADKRSIDTVAEKRSVDVEADKRSIDVVADERSIGAVAANVSKWAKTGGTEFGRYVIDGGEGMASEPEYRSENCTIYLATDISKPKEHEHFRVVLKFMVWRYQFYGEIRCRINGGQVPDVDVDIPSGASRFSSNHVIPLLRYHLYDCDLVGGQSIYVGVLVMPVGERSLKQVLDDHHISRDLEMIVNVATDVGKALAHIHEKGVVHGEFTPRNVMWLEGNWKIIDFDAAVDILIADTECTLTEKYSSGYIPPEVARKRFSQAGSRAQIARRLEGFERMKETMDPKRWATNYASKFQELERKLTRLQYGSAASSRVSFTIDIWSYGVLLYQLLVGKEPFPCNSITGVLEQSTMDALLTWKGPSTKDLEMVLQDCKGAASHTKKIAIQVLCLCMEGDPAKRASSMDQVLNLPFFQKDAQTQPDPAPLTMKKDTPHNVDAPHSPKEVAEMEEDRSRISKAETNEASLKVMTKGNVRTTIVQNKTGTLHIENSTLVTFGQNDRLNVNSVGVTPVPVSPEPYDVVQAEETKLPIESEFENDYAPYNSGGAKSHDKISGRSVESPARRLENPSTSTRPNHQPAQFGKNPIQKSSRRRPFEFSEAEQPNFQPFREESIASLSKSLENKLTTLSTTFQAEIKKLHAKLETIRDELVLGPSNADSTNPEHHSSNVFSESSNFTVTESENVDQGGGHHHHHQPRLQSPSSSPIRTGDGHPPSAAPNNRTVSCGCCGLSCLWSCNIF